MKNLIIFLSFFGLMIPSVNGQNQTMIIHDVEHYLVYDYEDVMDQLNHNVVANPQSALHLIKRAKYRMHQGQDREAANDLEVARRLNPFFVDLYYYEGPEARRKLIQGTSQQMQKDLALRYRLAFYDGIMDRAYASGDIDFFEWSMLSEACEYIRSGELERANTLLQDLVTSFSPIALIHDLQGLVALELDDLNSAGVAIRKALAIDPGLSSAWYNWSRYQERSGNVYDALSALDRSIQLDDNLTKAVLDRARLHSALGEYDAALTDYTRLIENSDYLSDQAYIRRGLLGQMTGNYQQSLNDLEEALVVYPDNPVLWKNLGNLQLIHGAYTEAVEAYTRALQLQHDYPEAWYNRGIAHMLQYNFEAGCQDLDRSVAMGFTNGHLKATAFCYSDPH